MTLVINSPVSVLVKFNTVQWFSFSQTFADFFFFFNPKVFWTQSGHSGSGSVRPCYKEDTGLDRGALVQWGMMQHKCTEPWRPTLTDDLSRCELFLVWVSMYLNDSLFLLYCHAFSLQLCKRDFSEGLLIILKSKKRKHKINQKKKNKKLLKRQQNRW